MALHVTNGDVAAARLQDTLGIAALPWRDILHEGPVPAGLAPGELAAVRAAFIAGAGWGGGFAEVLAEFRARDAALGRLGPEDELVLWFEHDLYDQLQLIQILARLHARQGRPRRLRLFQSHRHLGILTPAEIEALAGQGVALEEPAFRAASLAWEVFTSATPERLAALQEQDVTALPCLWRAIRRLLEELPRPRSGLSATETLALGVLAEGPARPSTLFAALQDREPASFMGDLPFFARLEEVGLGQRPLIAGVPQGGFVPGRIDAGGLLRLTEDGAAALAGRIDRVALQPLRRWLGGTWMSPGSVWRWDPAGSALTRDR